MSGQKKRVASPEFILKHQTRMCPPIALAPPLMPFDSIPISSSRLKPSRPEGAQRRPPHNSDDRTVPNYHAAALTTGAPTAPNTDLIRQRKVVDAFLAASRAGDFDGLLALLDPDVVLRSDPAAVPPGTPTEIRGAAALASRAAKGGARAAQPALVNGAVAESSWLRADASSWSFASPSQTEKINEIEAVADPGRPQPPRPRASTTNEPARDLVANPALAEKNPFKLL